MSTFPRRSAAREFGEARIRLRRAINPCFERFPVFRWNGDDAAVEYFGFGGLYGFTAHEIAKRRARLIGRRFKDRALVGGNPNAEDRRGVSLSCHAYYISIQIVIFQGFSAWIGERAKPRAAAKGGACLSARRVEKTR